MAKTDLIEIKQMGGIKCDNPDCDYINNDVPVSDYKNWINRSCPCCGANLLTEADYKSCKTLLTIVNLVNRIGKLLPKKIVDELRGEPKGVMHVKWDGSGSPSIDIKEEK